MPKLRVVVVPAITNDALTCLYLGGLSSSTSIKTRLPTGSDLEDILDLSRGPILFGSFDGVEVFTHLWLHKLTSVPLRSEVKFDPSLLQIIFDSLHAFRNLQCIRVSKSSDFTFGLRTSHWRGDLEEIGEAWSYIEVLLLNETYGSMSGAAHMSLWISLSEVVRFVGCYPCLKKLCIGITISSVDYDYDIKGQAYVPSSAVTQVAKRGLQNIRFRLRLSDSRSYILDEHINHAFSGPGFFASSSKTLEPTTHLRSWNTNLSRQMDCEKRGTI
ncbi:uncharacterized protein BJ212DRAFT_1295782 [Suillus subaureus]|uniref:Uncharacterized protein n=1 Tax=Suillus subaureus TaxID=48587 RepID=A0A9P7JIW9_9AGAM|nr:uncharacterized protein BJ212DRAFT_1295782 [Suillus subaureus]KAG1824669.1 hypothetical protein BJ212DRAFT_1295782 [Suillus subaureus]